METPQRSLVPGIILIALGLLFLIPRLLNVHLGELWPLLIFGGGIGFYVGFIHDRSNYGLLMPGTILSVIGLLFLYCTFEGWYMMETLWPIFIIAPGVGFVLMYLFGQGNVDCWSLRGFCLPSVRSFCLSARSMSISGHSY